MRMSNNEIYNHALAMNKAFNDDSQRLPIKINFFIQKNKAHLFELGQDIENARAEIIKTFGIASEDNTDQYTIPPDKVDLVQKELFDLLALEQEVNIYTIKLDDFPDDISLTTGQMEAIMFMIEQ